jgi:hypothetical protein
MTASHVGDGNVHTWVRTCLPQTWHLIAQWLTPAALTPALPFEEGGTTGNRLRRVNCCWYGPDLLQDSLIFPLVRATRAVLPFAAPVVVALDISRVHPKANAGAVLLIVI